LSKSAEAVPIRLALNIEDRALADRLAALLANVPGLRLVRGNESEQFRALSVSHAMKAALGVLLILIGALVLAGFDKRVETVLVNASPQWLTDLTTRF